jgi:hypothetical protein
VAEGNTKEQWFGVRCVFKWGNQPTYEERVTLWYATSFDEAIEAAELEAERYADGHDYDYLGIAQSYEITDATIGNGSEVFSLLRDSDLDPDDYVDSFFDTGSERHQT